MASTSTASVDSRGVQRGRCTSCSCDGYDGGSELKKCVKCAHPPGKHQNMAQASGSSAAGSAAAMPTSSESVTSVLAASPTSPSSTDDDSLFTDSTVSMPTSPVYPPCAFPGCSAETYFDLNTGFQSAYCQQHLSSTDGLTVPHFATASSAEFSGDEESVKDNDGDGDDDEEDTNGGAKSSQLPSRMNLFSSLIGSIFIRSWKKESKPEPPPQPSVSTVAAPAHVRPNTAPAVPVASLMPSAVPPTNVVPPPPNPTASLNLSSQQICKLPGCSRPKYVEPSGKVHDFCGRRHAREYQQQSDAAVPAHMKCSTAGCNKQKCRNPSGGYFNYCSKYCRDNGILPTSPSTPNLQDPSGYGTCSLPGCTRPKYRDPANGRVHDFCGRTHANEARAQGIPAASSSIVRSASSSEFTNVSQKFTNAWNLKKGACPKVDFVFVISNSTLLLRWTAYKQKLSNQTVEEYYHGTKLTCNLAKAPCTDSNCSICGISSTGLDRRCIRKNINFQRFGHGFYLAPNSSKCHDYTQGAHGYRAMLLCDVCPGRKYSIPKDDVALKAPPSGYDSVFGQVGSRLNYAEIVVYNPDAVVPRYIIVYQRDGEHKIAQ